MTHDHDDDHHDNELDPIAARVRALETILAGKGLVDPAAIDAIVEPTKPKSDRGTARRWSPKPGAIPTSPTG